MCVIKLLFLLLMWNQDLAGSVRIVDLRVSAQAAEGGEMILGCQFDMEDDVLYSIKWYKDGREFYRYIPRNPSPISRFPAPGVIVDLSRSSSNVVTLIHLTRESAGMYACEVSGEAPSFATVSEQKQISIYQLPESGPELSGLQHRYGIGDEVILNCTSAPSRPEAQLKWLLNEKPVPEAYVYGPWYKLQTNVSQPPIRTKLTLKFRVMPDHFINGVMTVKCQATIAPLYHKETHYTFYLEIPSTSTTMATKRFEIKRNTSPDDGTRLTFSLSVMIMCLLFLVIYQQ